MKYVKTRLLGYPCLLQCIFRRLGKNIRDFPEDVMQNHSKGRCPTTANERAQPFFSIDIDGNAIANVPQRKQTLHAI
jgi:hypothetical protein